MGHLHIVTKFLSKSSIISLMFSFPKLLPNSVVQWVRVLHESVSLEFKSRWGFSLFLPFQKKIFNTFFFKYCNNLKF